MDVLRLGLLICALAAMGTAACSDGAAAGRDVEPSSYVTASVVFGDVTSSYVAPFGSLAVGEIDVGQALEFQGWADAWVHQGSVYVADGEAPRVTRYRVGEEGLSEHETIEFEGAKTAAFWTNLFVKEQKAYLFNIDAREVVVWNTDTMTITGRFGLPELPDRGAQVLQVPSTDRSSVVRGNRAYVPTIWANFDEFDISDDSVILVIDTEQDKVIDTLRVDCPNLNAATVDDDGNIYFSNWMFGAASALMYDKPSTCAVRIPAGSDALDDWTLRFSDVTGGREGAALTYLGANRMLMSVFHHERVEIEADTDPNDLIGGADWQFWLLDLGTMKAEPVTSLGFNAGGVYGKRIEDRYFLLVPSEDYGSTKAYVWEEDGEVEQAWSMTGWSTRLFAL